MAVDSRVSSESPPPLSLESIKWFVSHSCGAMCAFPLGSDSARLAMARFPSLELFMGSTTGYIRSHQLAGALLHWARK